MLSPLVLYQSSVWQRDVHRLMGLHPPSPYHPFGVLALALAIFLVLLGCARAVRAVIGRFARFFGRWVPPAVARVVAAAVVTVLGVALVDGLVANVLLRAANASFKALNRETNPSVAPPRNSALSGSPESLVTWASLGRQGRDFVAGGPTTADLQQFSGDVPTPPIRVYVGLDSAPTVQGRAALAVRELQRTGAFSRAVLCVVTTTGTGWVDRPAVDSLEYLYNGATALVAVQYSYLPSVLSFIVDRDRARAAGRELFNQVYAQWSQLPPGRRPKLLVFGESLGAFGAESAFSGVDDMRNRTDGVLLTGPPNASALWREFTAQRDPGSREILPVYRHGAAVRFAGRPSDLAGPPSPWTPPRIVYLQHASDPVVWWSPGLMLARPDWLEERRGRDVLGSIRWYPFVTFWQLTADLVHSLHMPPGHGHNYREDTVDAWTRIAPPPGWTDARTDSLNATMAAKE